MEDCQLQGQVEEGKGSLQVWKDESKQSHEIGNLFIDAVGCKMLIYIGSMLSVAIDYLDLMRRCYQLT